MNDNLVDPDVVEPTTAIVEEQVQDSAEIERVTSTQPENETITTTIDSEVGVTAKESKALDADESSIIVTSESSTVPQSETLEVSTETSTTSILPQKPAFAIPNNPHTLPQDIEMILSMVDKNEVELAALTMNATTTEDTNEAREQIEVEVKESDASSPDSDSSDTDSGEDSDAASSSSDESVSSAVSSVRGPPPAPSGPMSESTRNALLAQLTTFYAQDTNEGLDEDGVGYITADSDELEEGEVDIGLGWGSESDRESNRMEGVMAAAIPAVIRSAGKGSDDELEESEDEGQITLMDIEDSDEEGGAGGPSEPPKTKHEVDDDQVTVPSTTILPQEERLVLAGEVMSMLLNVKLPEELAPDATDATTDHTPEEPTTSTTAPENAKPKGKGKAKSHPSAKSAGTIVVRALRPPLDSEKLGGLKQGDDEGWLEEGSLICLENRQVLAVVAETFGPLTQPFYLLRIPPAPYPLPLASSLQKGTKVYYPASGNRSFVPVRMLKTDKRYRGTDASNLHDEEVSESEKEWSDDEAELAAKRQKKAAKNKGKAAVPDQMRHWDAGSGEPVDDANEFLDYASGPSGNHDDDNRSMTGMSTISTRSGRTGPVRYDDIVPSGSMDTVRDGEMTSPRGRGARSGTGRGRGRGGAGGEQTQRVPERTRDQRGRGRGDHRGGAARGAGRGGRGGQAGPGRNPDGGRQIGRGRGRGGLTGSNAQPNSERSREMSPTSLAIARATAQAPVLPQATGFAQPMAASSNMPMQQQYSQDQGMMGSPFGWQQQNPYFYMPMQQQQHYGQYPGMQQQQQQQQQQPAQGAFNPAFAARMMGMNMGMNGGMQFPYGFNGQNQPGGPPPQ